MTTKLGCPICDKEMEAKPFSKIPKGRFTEGAVYRCLAGIANGTHSVLLYIKTAPTDRAEKLLERASRISAEAA